MFATFLTDYLALQRGIRWEIAVQKHERLISAAPSSNYDCSGMRSLQRLLSVIKHASAQGALMLLDVTLDAFALIPSLHSMV
jgi:hypothetical protein